jgi:tetratricopeptide (TPR) repeat protein
MAQKKKKRKPAAKKGSSPRKAAPGIQGGKPTAKKPSGNALPLPGGGSIESEMAKIGRLLEGKDFESIEEAQAFLDGIVKSGGLIPDIESATPLDKAQELIYDAWQESGRERVNLAKRALEVCPDCADAYVILAQKAEGSPLEALALYREGVEAAERALGPDYFEEDVGHFWGILETRPYMRARLGLAMTLWELGKQVEAVSHLRDMLRLNPGDNQGIRYILASCLLMMDGDEELQELLDSYEDEPTACWSYTRALLSFRREGDTGASRRLLEEAFKCNPHVPDYLLRKKELPGKPPDTIGFVDETEAIEYAFETLLGWSLTPGALEWLKDGAPQGAGLD